MDGGASRRTELVAFLRTVQRPGASLEALADDQDFFDAGLVDSLAMLQIILFLERSYGIDLAEAAVDPVELNSIAALLALIEEAGR